MLKFRNNVNFLKGYLQKWLLWEQKQANSSNKNIHYLCIRQGGKSYIWRLDKNIRCLKCYTSTVRGF